MQTSRLPLELIGLAISHSVDSGDLQTLLDCSTTCRDIHSWSVSFLVSHFKFKSEDQIHDFCDFLKAKPHLKPSVRSVTMDPDHFDPDTLFSVLPNLSDIAFTRPRLAWKDWESSRPNNTDPIPTILHLPPPGSHIRTLRLSNLLFTTPLVFVKALSAFTNLIHLVCTNVAIGADGCVGSQETSPQKMRKRLSKLQLQTLTVDVPDFKSYIRLKGTASSGELLLDWGSGGLGLLSTVERLTVKVCTTSYTFPQQIEQSSLNQLRSLFLETVLDPSNIKDITMLLEKLPTPVETLKDLVVIFHSTDEHPEPQSWIVSMIGTLGRSSPGTYQGFEAMLLQCPRSQIVFQVEELHAGSRFFWILELGKFFPELFKRPGAITLLSNNTCFHSGHENRIFDLVSSLDGMWMASAAEDGTIILWDAGSGQIARRWIAHDHCGDNFLNGVYSLAFSPDGRYLVSGAESGLVAVWDLTTQDTRKAAMLEGHTEAVVSCAWSPRGDVIATASWDSSGAVRLWDAHTFQLLSVLVQGTQNYGNSSLEFSPAGPWLFYRCTDFHCIWNIPSASLIPHKPHWRAEIHRDHDRGRSWSDSSPPGSALNREGTRLLVATPNEAPKLFMDVSPGVISLGTTPTSAAALSSDGKLAVTRFGDHKLKIWDADTGAELSLLEHLDTPFNDPCFSLSPCGKYIATGVYDGTVRLWRITTSGTEDNKKQTCVCVATFSDHSSQVLPVAFSSDGKTFWSGDVGGTVIMRRMCDIIPAEDLDL